MKLITSSSSGTTSSQRGADGFRSTSLSLLRLIIPMAVCRSFFDGLLGGSGASLVLGVSTGSAAGLGLGRVGVLGSSFSSVSSIVNLAFDFFGAVGIGAAIRFRGDLGMIVDDLKASRASSSACIWSLQSSLPSVDVTAFLPLAAQL